MRENRKERWQRLVAIVILASLLVFFSNLFDRAIGALPFLVYGLLIYGIYKVIVDGV